MRISGLITINHDAVIGSLRSVTSDAVNLPIELRCPITQALFRDPVMTRMGQTYDRSAIEAYWASCEGGVCRDPLSNQEVPSQDVTPNFVVRRLVQQFLDDNPAYTPAGWPSRELAPVMTSNTTTARAASPATQAPRGTQSTQGFSMWPTMSQAQNGLHDPLGSGNNMRSLCIGFLIIGFVFAVVVGVVFLVSLTDAGNDDGDTTTTTWVQGPTTKPVLWFATTVTNFISLHAELRLTQV